MCYLPVRDPRGDPLLALGFTSEDAGRYVGPQPVCAHGHVQLGDLVRAQLTDAFRQGQEPVLLVGVDDTTGQRPELLDVVLALERSGPERMGVRNGDLVLGLGAVIEPDDHATAEGLLGRIGGVVAPGPLRVLDRADLPPQAHGVGPSGTLGRVAALVVPTAVL